MQYPLRTIIRCSEDGQNMGSVVVIRGDPVYDDTNTVVGYKNQFMQIRRGSLKGKECRAFFTSLDEWHRSMQLSSSKNDRAMDNIYCLNTVFAGLIIVVSILAAYV